jgi:hypothetical protein
MVHSKRHLPARVGLLLNRVVTGAFDPTPQGGQGIVDTGLRTGLETLYIIFPG